MTRIQFFQEMISSLFSKKDVIKSLPWFEKKDKELSIQELIKNVMNAKGEVSAIIYAENLFKRIEKSSSEELIDFFVIINEELDIDKEKLKVAAEKYSNDTSSDYLAEIINFSEPKRKELLRRLNACERGTIRLVRLREKLLKIIKFNSDLKKVDFDFVKLFKSWFNPGFLVLRPIDWTTPAHILEKIIFYEAVHEIKSWDDLRSRLEPIDRRCFAFFHPAMQDEPLIFVQVAIMNEIPSSIDQVLKIKTKENKLNDKKTAIFYSISNCQDGLKGISFGNFLIKTVAKELQKELNQLNEFVTLSPFIGFMNWCKNNDKSFFDKIVNSKLINDEQKQSEIKNYAYDYILKSNRKDNLPNDPVARFHLGNGAIVERINLNADLSDKAMKEGAGIMINYKYDLNNVEKNHEEFVKNNTVILSQNANNKLKELKNKIKVI